MAQQAGHKEHPWACPRYTRIMPLGRLLISLGIALAAVGLLLTFAGRLPFKLGRLPGDIYVHGRSSRFYFPSGVTQNRPMRDV